MKKVFLPLFSFLILFFASNGAESIMLQQGTPVFREPNLKQKPLMIVEKPTESAILGEKISLYEKTPLMKFVPFVQISIPGQGSFWAPPNVYLQVNPTTRSYSYEFEKNPFFMLLGVLCILGALITVGYSLKRNSRTWAPVTAIVLICWGILFYLIGASGNILQRPVDEFGYFAVAQGLAALDFSGRWLYTVGLPLFYLPFLFLWGSASLYDILFPFLIFSGFLVMPFACVMAYLAIKKLSDPQRAFSAFLICTVFFLIYRHSYILKNSNHILEECLIKSYPAFPSAELAFPLFELYTLFGYNALSDTLSAALIFSCIVFLLYRKETLGSLAIFSALFALACLVRVNNILYAPLMLLLLYLRDADHLCGVKPWFRRLAVGAASFLAVFSLQLIVNQIQFGGILRFPYALHGNNAGAGFLFSVLPDGISFLCTANHVWFVLGTLSLFFVRDRRARTILAFWIFPVIFFFFGYPVVFNNATRFILPVYIGFAAAIALCAIWEERRSVKLRTLAILLPAILLTAPAGSPKITKLLPWNWQDYGMTNEIAGYLQLILIAVSLLLLLSFLRDWSIRPENRKQTRNILLFLGLFVILFYWANPFATALLMGAAFLRSLYDAGVLIKKARAECASGDAEST